ncbi:hypothetical protein O7605_30505 [Verrucosispora sp. WMMA2121]|uniref:hypothetical protein n=1 Tax=Verrucosispora sp. WMMA2121 TaxID=3015164 RepID=UPI0022B6B530|nr:hypothetical protein [Verrucosispora sp. WMMA2121]MCZ7423846.1 hypothetical protein [Verrucosispora sp. WMMA2121]
MIAGFEEFPLIDGASMLQDFLFWPTYLSATMAPHRDSLVTEAFAVDVAACFEYFDRLTDPDEWPVFRISLRDGYEIDLVYWNEPDDNSTEFVLRRSGQNSKLVLASVGGHEFRPGMSWPELVAAANLSGDPHGIVEPHARLLLLLPAFGDADLPADANGMVAAALRSCGAGVGAGELAAYMLRQPERWPRWRSDVNGALVCDGRHSRRNPAGPAAHSPADLLEISTALAAR